MQPDQDAAPLHASHAAGALEHGGDVTTRGCKTSAGQLWCDSLARCISTGEACESHQLRAVGGKAVGGGVDLRQVARENPSTLAARAPSGTSDSLHHKDAPLASLLETSSAPVDLVTPPSRSAGARASLAPLAAPRRRGRDLLWTGEHGYCELCIYAVHQVQYGQLPSCGGTAKTFSYSSCSQVVQSMLAYAHDVMHLISYGCYQYDAYKGWQTVRPCPAHVICGRLPNIYDLEKQSQCPADFHFRFPHALANMAPKTPNPLLPFAMAAYRDPTKSSILQEQNAAGLEVPPSNQAGQGGMEPRFKEQGVDLVSAHVSPPSMLEPRREDSIMRGGPGFAGAGGAGGARGGGGGGGGGQLGMGMAPRQLGERMRFREQSATLLRGTQEHPLPSALTDPSGEFNGAPGQPTVTGSSSGRWAGRAMQLDNQQRRQPVGGNAPGMTLGGYRGAGDNMRFQQQQQHQQQQQQPAMGG